MEKEVRMSSMGKTWILDLDGTIVKHNGYKIDGKERCIQKETEEFLKENGIRYDHIIYNAPYGERILINDSKPSGLPMAYAFRPKRDELFEEGIVIDEEL